MNIYEFEDRFSGRYFGKYRGVVDDNQDPKNLFRIKAIVPVVMGSEESLGWAFPLTLTGGGKNVGDTWLPAKGDYVWIEFEGGDTSSPLWSAGPWPIREGVSTAPKHARAEPDVMDYAVRDMGNTSPSQFEGTYGHVRSIQGYDGSLLEFDATPSAERVQLAHFSGSRLEMFSDGSVEEVCIANNRRLVMGVQNVRVGARDELIMGNKKQQVDGLTENQFVGNVAETYTTVTQTGKNFTGNWEGLYELNLDGEYRVSSLGNGALSFTGQLSTMAGSNMQVAVMEYLSISASSSLSVPGVSTNPPSILMHGYNGTVKMKATDVSGKALGASLTLDASLAAIAHESTWKVFLGPEDPPTPALGQIQLTSALAPAEGPNVHLGSGILPKEPIVLGNQLILLLNNILTYMKTHMHPTGTGMSGTADPAAVAVAGLVESQLTIDSKAVGGILSGYPETS